MLELPAKERRRRKHKLALMKDSTRFGVDWWVWRPVFSEIATLSEVRSWSLRDLVEAHAALDARDAIAEYDRANADADGGK